MTPDYFYRFVTYAVFSWHLGKFSRYVTDVLSDLLKKKGHKQKYSKFFLKEKHSAYRKSAKSKPQNM